MLFCIVPSSTMQKGKDVNNKRFEKKPSLLGGFIVFPACCKTGLCGLRHNDTASFSALSSYRKG